MNNLATTINQLGLARKAILVLGVLLLPLLVITNSQSSRMTALGDDVDQGDEHRNRKHIAGAYFGKFFTSPDSQGIPFLATFHRDGTTTSVASNDFGGPDMGFKLTDAAGNWVATGHRSIKGRILVFASDQAGVPAAIFRTSLQVESDRSFQSLRGMAHAEIFFCGPSGEDPFYTCPDPLTTSDPPDLGPLPLRVELNRIAVE